MPIGICWLCWTKFVSQYGKGEDSINDTSINQLSSHSIFHHHQRRWRSTFLPVGRQCVTAGLTQLKIFTTRMCRLKMNAISRNYSLLILLCYNAFGSLIACSSLFACALWFCRSDLCPLCACFWKTCMQDHMSPILTCKYYVSPAWHKLYRRSTAFLHQ